MSLGNWLTIASIVISFIVQQATLQNNVDKIEKAVEEQASETQKVSQEVINTNLSVKENALRIEYLQQEIREKSKN
ncbi:hypothetical protein [Bernardetia sp.]|uniref:hypothetical protein n=1 Tax=Bernardetia sp. TaxID=1937974 RepID=UPI0025C2C36F|nr:hypothetical protein [Bernardetia sp.]